MGCQYGQGNLFSSPVDIETVEHLLSDSSTLQAGLQSGLCNADAMRGSLGSPAADA
jgi:hypothetical protein